MQIMIGAVSLMALGWRRHTEYKKRGKKVSAIHTMVSTCGLPDNGKPAKFKRHQDGKRIKDYEVPRQQCFETYHSPMPMVDQHNAQRQSYLGLETGWSTKDALLRFFACWLGVIVVNSFLAVQYFSTRDNPIRRLDQSALIKKFTFELLDAERQRAASSSSSSPLSTSPTRPTEDKPFDFLPCRSQQRCQADGCKGTALVKCALCSNNNLKGADGALCATNFDRAKGGIRAADQEVGEAKRGGLAMHAAMFHGAKMYIERQVPRALDYPSPPGL